MSHAPLTNFIAENAFPIDPANPGAAIDRFLMSCSSDLQLLGLGEALHGSEDLLWLRNRIFQHLVEQDDFRAIAIEASLPHARAMNEYILGGPGTYDDLQAGAISHGWGKYASMRDLIEWMRAYNADPAHDIKLHFYGFDLPAKGMGPASPASLFEFAIAHLETLDPATAAKHREKASSLLGAETQWENPMLWRDPAQNKPLIEAAGALRVEAQKLIAALNKHRANFPSTAERRTHEEAAHYAKLARHHLSFFITLADKDWAPALGARDALQADNLEFIVERERPRGRVLAFAHNKHLQKSKASWQLGEQKIEWSPAGAHLAHTMGTAYANLATAIPSAEFIQLPPAEPNSLESLLRPGTVLPTRSAPAISPDLLTRGSTKTNPTYFALTSSAMTDFDAIITLDIVS